MATQEDHDKLAELEAEMAAGPPPEKFMELWRDIYTRRQAIAQPDLPAPTWPAQHEATA